MKGKQYSSESEITLSRKWVTKKGGEGARGRKQGECAVVARDRRRIQEIDVELTRRPRLPAASKSD